jgi:predicted transposase/invertase (TIGR01784 family)
MSKQESVHNPHDKFFKKLMSDPQNVRDFISGFLPPELSTQIDLDTLKHKDREQLTKKNRQFHLDLVLTCQLAGQEAEIYLVFEHKSAFDKLTLVQILTYCAALWEQNILTEKRAPVPVIPVVFYHGKEAFVIPKRFGHYFDVDDSLKGYMVDFGYAIFNTADIAEDEIAGRSYDNLYLAASLMAFKRIFDSLQDMEVTLRHVMQLDETSRFLIFEYLVTSKDVKSDEFEQAIRRIGGNDMPTIAEQWIEQGRLEGELKGELKCKLEGKLEGEKKGEIKGMIKGLMEGIQGMLEIKFGNVPSELLNKISAISDLAKLESLKDCIKRATDYEQVLKML